MSNGSVIRVVDSSFIIPPDIFKAPDPQVDSIYVSTTKKHRCNNNATSPTSMLITLKNKES